ncbi:RNA polymerase sigma-70 factor (ECF subfamily) [Salirhabdus euzebyi]|uniref:RNA polymerase sigma-70 factor (ECF subfamily) n=1 Tax=Salirhabdus euzebyi TaxID=394506 RepID=A0A841Q4C9_9BACI|nr:sigma-70 family RNA polymerase sigma factor [Salirhabdus euzebyi]MBB6453266.1 RNA polymerase sigma-70 factor (ECF subfamily) [Salirhabdus euzebyi]
MEIQLLRTDNCVSEIMNKYADMVFRLCLVQLKNKADAEDAFQEIFIKLFEKSPLFHDEKHLKAWLITVTSNHCKNKFRSYWYKNRVNIEEIIIPIENKKDQEVIKYVMELPLKYRTVIYLYYYEGYSTKEIAGLLKSKEATVRTRLARGRELLKHHLKVGGFPDE